MQVQSINFYNKNNVYFARNSTKVHSNFRSTKTFQDAASTAGAWFTFGLGLDFVSRKFQFSKSPTKNSIILNGINASVAGGYTAFKTISSKKNNH